MINVASMSQNKYRKINAAQNPLPEFLPASSPARDSSSHLPAHTNTNALQSLQINLGPSPSICIPIPVGTPIKNVPDGTTPLSQILVTPKLLNVFTALKTPRFAHLKTAPTIASLTPQQKLKSIVSNFSYCFPGEKTDSKAS